MITACVLYRVQTVVSSFQQFAFEYFYVLHNLLSYMGERIAKPFWKEL
jgi:hypothetical protein